MSVTSTFTVVVNALPTIASKSSDSVVIATSAVKIVWPAPFLNTVCVVVWLPPPSGVIVAGVPASTSPLSAKSLAIVSVTFALALPPALDAVTVIA